MNHPNICVIHEVGETSGEPWIAMECVEGVTLSNYIAAGALPPDDIVHFGMQIADGLSHAHERGIVHRDLKPGNVIITPEKRLKIVDFGLAKSVKDEEMESITEVRLTVPGTGVGTPAYMSPEQLRGLEVDRRTDIWSFGVILYELATGERPFRGRTAPELTSGILTAPPLPLPRAIAADLASVIYRCLAKDPRQRYQRASEVRAALEVVQSRGSGASQPLAIPGPATISSIAVLPLADCRTISTSRTESPTRSSRTSRS